MKTIMEELREHIPIGGYCIRGKEKCKYYTSHWWCDLSEEEVPRAQKICDINILYDRDEETRRLKGQEMP